VVVAVMLVVQVKCIDVEVSTYLHTMELSLRFQREQTREKKLCRLVKEFFPYVSLVFPCFSIEEMENINLSSKKFFYVCSKVKMGEPGGGGEERWEK
jgi:hypothetical protein